MKPSEEATVPLDVEPESPPPQHNFRHIENRETPNPIPGRSSSDNRGTEQNTTMANFPLDDLIGRSYLTNPNENGTRRRLTIIERLNDMDNARQNNPDVIRFRAKTDDESISEIITHNQLLDKIECDDGENK